MAGWPGAMLMYVAVLVGFVVIRGGGEVLVLVEGEG